MMVRRFAAVILALGLLATGIVFSRAQSWDQLQKVVTIAPGASLSGAVDLAGSRMLALVIPASWTTASVSMQASPDGVTYSNVYVDGTELTVTATSSNYMGFSTPAELLGIRYVKIRSGTSASPVTQTNGAQITIINFPWP
ncbi:MAG: hypothetical protein ABIO35_08285 [Nitrobacter sp.]